MILKYATFVALLLCLLQWGCVQRIDPGKADEEVRRLLDNVPGFDWEPNDQSRLVFSENNSLPIPPMDDNLSREITIKIQKNDAYVDGNESSLLENRQWRKSLPVDANGSVLLNLETAMELALLHSREFQQQKEALYLSALDVTYERFQLGPVPFAGVSGQVSQEIDEDTSDFQSRAKAGFRGIAGRGTSWVVSLANRLSIELSGGDVEVGGSLANLTVTQPLLRGASRRIYLEKLTQSERSLLADARSLEQFRQGFFLHVVLGSNPAGTVGSSGVISAISPPSTGVSGFLGLVQELQRIRNQEANVAKLNDSLLQLEAAFEAGRIGSRLQVDQARQALFNGQSRLLAAKSSFANRQDGYKLFLGLPPDLSMRVMDDYIESFRLSDSDLVGLQEEVNNILSAVRNPDEVRTIESLRAYFDQIIGMQVRTELSMDNLREDFAKFQQVLPLRKKGFASLRKRSDLKELGMGEDTFRDRDLDNLMEELNSTINGVSSSLRVFYQSLDQWDDESESLPLDIIRGRLSALLNGFSGTLLELSLVKASARLESIIMEEVMISPKDSTEVASSYRMDWKNNRAALVNVWRKADLAKEDLKSDLDLVLSGDLGSDSMGAGQFESDESRIRVGIELDTPLSKVRERNRYKASLLRYQQARRSYLAYEDSILRAFRAHQRLAKLFQLNFELSRAAVRGAIAQVDLARMRLGEPPQPGRNAQFGATTARDLVNALNDLLDASNSFVEVWIGYEAMRMRYAYDMGTMQLSEEGIWLDTAQ